jgi:hypothetical protein
MDIKRYKTSGEQNRVQNITDDMDDIISMDDDMDDMDIIDDMDNIPAFFGYVVYVCCTLIILLSCSGGVVALIWNLGFSSNLIWKLCEHFFLAMFGILLVLSDLFIYDLLEKGKTIMVVLYLVLTLWFFFTIHTWYLLKIT